MKSGNSTFTEIPTSMLVFVSSAWWDESDPFVHCGSRFARKTESRIKAAMKEEAKRAWENDDGEEFKKIKDALERIHTNGVQAVTAGVFWTDAERRDPETIREYFDGGVVEKGG